VISIWLAWWKPKLVTASHVIPSQFAAVNPPVATSCIGCRISCGNNSRESDAPFAHQPAIHNVLYDLAPPSATLSLHLR
jgi:hypothetical protein